MVHLRSVLCVAAVALAWSPSASAVCGDGVVDAEETCDDLNSDDGDGCDSSCVVEPGWESVDAEFSLDVAEALPGGGLAASWSLSSDGLTLTQSANSAPSVFMSTGQEAFAQQARPPHGWLGLRRNAPL